MFTSYERLNLGEKMEKDFLNESEENSNIFLKSERSDEEPSRGFIFFKVLARISNYNPGQNI